MARPCAICSHPERAEIDRALVVDGETYRNIAKRWGMSAAAAFRHRAEHIAEQVAKAAQAAEAGDVRQALDVIQQLKAANGVTLEVLQQARTGHDGRLALLAVDRVMKQCELQAKLLGELDERPVINIWLDPAWQTIERTLVEALAPHPQARLAVVDRLQALRIV
jgi:hypothetical protein